MTLVLKKREITPLTVAEPHKCIKKRIHLSPF